MPNNPVSHQQPDEKFQRLKSVLLTGEMDSHGRIRLLPERKLAEHLGIQRAAVRERLAILENLGLIRRTRGSGTFVQMPSPGFVQLYFDLAMRLGHISTDQMEQAREMLEREIARVAAIKANDGDVATLERLCNVMMTATNVAEGLRADHEFHTQLAYMTRNPVIILLVQGLSSVLRKVVHSRRVLIRQVPSGAERTNATHTAIVEAIRRRNPSAAVTAMEQHFRVWDEESARVGSGQAQQEESQALVLFADDSVTYER